MLELPHDFFLQQTIAACNLGLLAAFSFQAIDFTQPDGEFSFRGQTYQVKKYLSKYFFKHKLDKSDEFIYSIEGFSVKLESIICQQYAAEAIQLDLEQEVSIQRCIEYADTIFCLGYDYFTNLSQGEYCSFKSRYWIPFDWKLDRELVWNDILQLPREFFIKQAHTAQLPCYLEIDDEEIHPTLRAAYKFEGAEPLEFVRGSEAELKHLTQLAAHTLPELQPLFERYSSLKVFYTSEHVSYNAGFHAIYTEVPGKSRKNWFYKERFSPQVQRLLQLVYEYNLFTGSVLIPSCGGPGVNVYERSPMTITVEVQTPSQDEKQEAALKLQTWLVGKVPEAEIGIYLEGNYQLELPDPIDEQQLDNELQLEEGEDIPF